MCRLGVQSLPYLARVPPGLAISEGGAITLPKEELMSAANYPWCVEGSRLLSVCLHCTNHVQRWWCCSGYLAQLRVFGLVREHTKLLMHLAQLPHQLTAWSARPAQDGRGDCRLCDGAQRAAGGQD